MTTYNYINGRSRTPFNLSTAVGMKRLNECQHEVNPVRLKPRRGGCMRGDHLPQGLVTSNEITNDEV